MRIVTLLFLIYYILSYMFPFEKNEINPNRIYPQTVMMILCVVSLYSLLKNYQIIYKDNFFKPFLIYWSVSILYIIYPVYDPTTGENVLFDNFIFTVKSFASVAFLFYFFYELELKGDKAMKYILIIFLIQLVYTLMRLVSDYGKQMTDDQETFDSNAGFSLVCSIPMAFLINNKRLRLYLYAVIVGACLFSGQRSAALAAVFTVPIAIKYLRNYIRFYDVFLFGCLFIFIGVPILQSSIDNIALRNEMDLERDSFGSGRSEFWLHVLNGFVESNLLQMLIGHGCESVGHLLLKTYGIQIGSHNGWLDALYNYGIIGIILYITILWTILKNNRIINNKNPECHNLMLLIFVLFVVKCSTSHGYWDLSVIPLVMAMSIILYKTNMIKKEAD